VLPVGQLVAQAPLLHTPPVGHTVQLVPQCMMFEAAHAPPHETRPDAHWHVPFWHVVPTALHTLPQDPQF
jgi:hypothetical protein